MKDLSKLSNIDYKNASKVLEVKNLAVNFKSDSGLVHAVRGVSFDLYKGETLCIVGESGSGKSVTSKTIMGILANNAIIESGEILYEGEDLIRVSEEEFHRIRGNKIGMIFQDPLSSLNPIMKVGKQIIEATMINSNILKKHYNELISKELVNFRNLESNKNFEISKIDTEINQINDFIKKLKKNEKRKIKLEDSIVRFNKLLETESDLNKVSNFKHRIEEFKENIKDIEEFKLKVSTYFKNLKTRYHLELNNLETEVSKLKENSKKEKEEIINLKLDLLTKKKEYLTSYYNDVYDYEVDVFNALNLRKAKIKSFKAYFNQVFKTLLPYYKKDLNLRKKEAKVELKEYALNLKNEYEKNLYALKIEEDALISALEDYKLNKLNEEERSRFEIIYKEDQDLLYRSEHLVSKGSSEINISKITKEEEKITSTGNKEFDELYEKLKSIQTKIRILKNEYISKTKITKKEATRMALEVMKEVGIPLPEKRFKQYPFEFSGGMRQRIVIAIALTANPDILICDEPTTALDVTIQAQILELINKLKKERGLSCIFITHDLGVVANMADRVAVMYAGKIVEYGTSAEIFFDPKHPYTWSLLSSIPDVDSKEKLDAIPGTPPDLRYPPKGDAFALRSKYALAIDFKYEPPYFKVSDTHYAATWLLHENAPKVEMPNIVKTRIKEALKEIK